MLTMKTPHLACVILFAVSFFLPHVSPAEETAGSKKPWQCTLRLLDPDGKPVSGATVTAYQKPVELTPRMPGWRKFDPADPREHVSDDAGRVTISYDEIPPKTLLIRVNAAGFVWEQFVFGRDGCLVGDLRVDEIPDPFEVRLSRGEEIGGVVRDVRGKAVAGAVVLVDASPRQVYVVGRCQRIHDCPFVTKTDAEGKWTCRIPKPLEGSSAPSGIIVGSTDPETLLTHPGVWKNNVAVMVRHPDYDPKKTVCLSPEAVRCLRAQGKEIGEIGGLRCVTETSFDTVLDEGVRFTGCVVDAENRPIEGARALIRTEDRLDSWGTEAVSAEDGAFTLHHLMEKEYALAVVRRDGFAPIIETVSVAADAEPARFVMRKAKNVQIAIRDSAGRPVPARVSVFDEEGQMLTHHLELPQKADPNGQWKWNWAPGKACSYTISADGFDTVHRNLPPGEHAVTLKQHGRVLGRVIDAETKKPIARFFVSRKYVIDNDFLLFSNGRWRNLFVVDSPDGVFRCACREGPRSRTTESITLTSLDGRKSMEVREPKYVGVLFRIEAEGYMPVTSKTLQWKEGGIEVTFEMKKAAPLTGRIVDVEGRPVAGAEIAVVGENLPAVHLDAFEHDGFDRTDWPSQERFLKEESNHGGGDLSSDPYEVGEAIPKQPRHTRSDKDGRFTLFPQTAPYELVVVHKDGIACVDSERFKSSRDIVLNEWASLDGVLLVDDKPLPNTEIEIDPSPSPSTVTVNFGFAFSKTPFVQTPAKFHLDGAFTFSSTTVKTDADGRFKVGRLPPSSIEISRVVRAGDCTSWVKLKTITLSPGEIKKIRLEGDVEEE